MPKAGIVSIGYEGRDVDELLRQLMEGGVEVLVDVRLTPLSRKPGLSKRRLAERLLAVGIDYVHLRALGNPKDNREAFWSGMVAEGCDRFEGLMKETEATEALDLVASLVEEHVVAVLCFERDHLRCHRQVVTRLVTDRTQGDTVVLA